LEPEQALKLPNSWRIWYCYWWRWRWNSFYRILLRNVCPGECIRMVLL